ncbi:MAG: MOSC domain-containing protein [Thermomicrobiales bacterium]
MSRRSAETWNGSVVSIYTTPEASAPMFARDSIRAVAGRGLEGDRYFSGAGFYSSTTGPLREISLIEEETLEALVRDHEMVVEPGETRRNIITRGVPLNHLVGRDFRVGTAVIRGVKLCEPCVHLVALTGKHGYLANLLHRGGLHAEIVADGEIRIGDGIEPV